MAQAELGAALSWCCFTCQQVAEKALKALCERARLPHLGHNLNTLLRNIEDQFPVQEGVRIACSRLTRHYTSTRYPDAFDQGAPAEQFFEWDAHQAVDDAEEVLAFAEGVIGPP